MKNEGKTRIIFWSVIFGICFLASAIGMFKYYTGSGEKGKLRKDLMPYADIFNNLKKVKSQINADKIIMTADISGNYFVINYKSNTSNIDFLFTYKDENGVRTLTTVYDNDIVAKGDAVMQLLIDAISVKNGNAEQQLYNSYSYYDLQSVSLDKGIRFNKTSETTEVTLDIDKNVLTLLNGHKVDDVVQKYITLADLDNLESSLKANGAFNLEKNGTIVHILESNNSYEIYISNDLHSEYIYDSLCNIISAIDTSMFNVIKDSDIKFDTDIFVDNQYEIITNSTNPSTTDAFASASRIIYFKLIK